MYSVVRPTNGALASRLRQMMVVCVASVLILTTGCSWFKKGDTKEITPTPPSAYTQATPTPGTGVVPDNAPVEGPRAGDTRPFPELRPIYFDFDRASLRPDQLSRMEFNLKYLKEHPADKVLITGHCDERGTTEYNFVLGQKRAAAVMEYLVKGGVEAGRIQAQSKGEEEPVALGHDEASWSKNRRCEFLRMY